MAGKQSSKSKSATQTAEVKDRTVAAWEHSEAAKALAQLISNPRIKYVVLNAPADACPACQQLVGTYPKDQVPQLPFEFCSHPNGCRAFYMPFIEEMYP